MAKMQFAGTIIYPDGVTPQAPPLLNLPEQIEQQIYGQIKANLKRSENWTFEYNVHKDMAPLTVGFAMMGLTAGHVCFAYEPTPGKVEGIHAFTALLQGLDKEDDRKAIESIRHAKILASISQTQFDRALTFQMPQAVTFFTSLPDPYHAFVNTTVMLVAGAFFDGFGTPDVT